ncbi:MAG: hypothetical protein AAB912_03480 [Patescibacteria group bacterium]
MENDKERLAVFRTQHAGKRFIAISGGSDTETEPAIHDFLDAFFAELPEDRVVLITGGTRGGIPEYATIAGKTQQLPVIGIVPERAVGTDKILPMLDLVIGVEPRYGASEWGDESELFVKLADAIIFLGGNWGAALEFTRAMKINTVRVRHGEQPIYLIPILSIAGIPQALWTHAHRSVELMSACFPDAPTSSPQVVAAFLREKWWP